MHRWWSERLALFRRVKPRGTASARLTHLKWWRGKEANCVLLLHVRFNRRSGFMCDSQTDLAQHGRPTIWWNVFILSTRPCIIHFNEVSVDLHANRWPQRNNKNFQDSTVQKNIPFLHILLRHGKWATCSFLFSSRSTHLRSVVL